MRRALRSIDLRRQRDAGVDNEVLLGPGSLLPARAYTPSTPVRAVRRAAGAFWLLLAPTLLSVPAASAAESPPPQGVVQFTSSASVELTRDLLSVSFTTTREGADAAAVQSQLKQALDAALAEAKKVARPGQLDVQTGSFSLSPRYTGKGVVNGWQGSAELIVEGRDMQAIGQLSGRITTLTVGRVGFSLSRETREQSEAEVSARAIAGYRAKAADHARQFGYSSYVIRQVDIHTGEPSFPRPMMGMQARAASAMSEEALPVEPGKAVVTVSVTGSVQLLK